jgi:hypothetical protein
MSVKKDNSRLKVADDRQFRATLGGRSHTKVNKDPNFEYRWVITDVGYMKTEDEYERVDQFIDKGWNIVYSEDRPEDERANAPDNDTKNSERLKPVTKRLKGGNFAVLMKCSKEQREKNEKDKATRDNNELLRSVKSVKKQGNNVVVQDHDIEL